MDLETSSDVDYLRGDFTRTLYGPLQYDIYLDESMYGATHSRYRGEITSKHIRGIWHISLDT